MESDLIEVVPGELSCSARYRRIMELINFCARICGANITDPSFKMNWLTYIVIGIIFAYYGCTLYTVYVGVIIDQDWTIILQSFCFVGGAVQGMTKLFCCIAQRKALRDAHTFLHATYAEYETRAASYRRTLLDSIEVTMTCLKSFVVVYLGVISILTGFPVAYYAIYNEKIFIMQFLLPGLDHSTQTGYMLLFGAHLTCLCFGAFGNFAGDMYLFVIVNNVPLIKNILSCKLEDLNTLLQCSNPPAKPHTVREKMVDIVRWHQEYLSMLQRTQRIFFIVIFVQVFASASGILCSTFCMFIGVWPAAPAYLFYLMLALYMYCGLGSIVETSNHDCSSIIYTVCMWYELPLSEQRLILFMLHKSQATPNLSVGDMMPLTMATALQITKAVYSMLMLLMNNENL